MRRYPYTLLVCLSIIVGSPTAYVAQSHDFIHVTINPDAPPVAPLFSVEEPHAQVVPASARGYRDRGVLAPRVRKPIVKCAPEACPPPAMCAPPLMCPPPKQNLCILPRRAPGQFEAWTQVFFPKLGGTVRWPAQWNGISTEEFDPVADLGLPAHPVLLEYGARYQFRPNWAFYYSIMPINLEANHTLNRTIYYGGWVYPAGTRVNTKWDFTYQRAGILYEPIRSCSGSLAIYAGWTYNEQSLRLRSSVCRGNASTLDRTRQMAYGGAQLQRCIRTMCNGATLSSNCKADVNFLDGVFGVDAQSSLQFSVPMGAGRWGFARGGWRYLQLNENRNDMRLDAVFDGGFVEGGLIF